MDNGALSIALKTYAERYLLGSSMADAQQSRRRRMEIFAFLIVTALVMPALAVATVGTWGLTVWIYQAINGPPTSPSR